MAKGKITRKEIFDEKVLKVGQDYANSINPAVAANEKLLATLKSTALAYAQLAKDFKEVKTTQEFIALKEKELNIRNQTAEAIKKQQEAERDLIAVKEQHIAALAREKTHLEETTQAQRDLADAYNTSNSKQAEATRKTNKLKQAILGLNDNLKGNVSAFTAIIKTLSFYQKILTAINTVQKLGNVITKAATFVTNLKTAATKSATAAQRTFNTAVKSNPLGLLVALLATAVTAYLAFRNSAMKAEKAQKELNEARQRGRDLTGGLILEENKKRDETLKGIENDIRLRKAQGEDEKKLAIESLKRRRLVFVQQVKEQKLFLADAQLRKESLEAEIKANRERITRTTSAKAKPSNFTTTGAATSTIESKKSRLERIEKDIARVNNPLKVEVNKKEGVIEERRSTLEAANKEVDNIDKELIIQQAINTKEIIAENEKHAEELALLQRRLVDLQDGTIANDEAREIKQTERKFNREIAAIKGKSEVEIKLRAELENEKIRQIKVIQEKFSDERKTAENALTKFVLEQNIKTQDDIAKNEDNSYEDRLAAIKARQDEEIELAQQKRDILLKGVEAGSDAELLILEKFDAKKTALDKKAETDAGNVFLSRIKDLKEFEEVENDFLKQSIFAEQQRLKNKEISIQEFENNIVNLKTESAKTILEDQINYAEKELLALAKTQDQKLAVETLLTEKRQELSDITTQKFIEDAEKLEEIRQRFISETSQAISDVFGIDSGVVANFFDVLTKGWEDGITNAEKYAEIAQASIALISEVGNAVFAGNIQKIDDEIAKNEEFYARQIELAGNDQTQKDAIQAEAEQRRKELENKKRKEQIKQAKLEKATGAFSVGISTAIAIISALRPPPVGLGPLKGIPLAVAVGALGAVQLAAVLAKPIPQFEKGTKSHKGGLALVGEKRPEVIQEPGKTPYIISHPAILDLARKTVVTPSIDEYKDHFRKSALSSLSAHSNKLKAFNTTYLLNHNNDDLLVEMKLTRKAIEKNQPRVTIHQLKPPDLDHEFFRAKAIGSA